MFNEIISYIRKTYNKPEGVIPLHEPSFYGKEKEYLIECIDSTFVSSIGKYVTLFEDKIKDYTGAKYAIACANGTLALHMALLLADVKQNDLVITQPLTFIATCNSIKYTNADPLFIDIDTSTLGLSFTKLQAFFENQTIIKDDGFCYHKKQNRRIKACLPMHTFGHAGQIDKIAQICKENNVILVEDAAESIGTKYKDISTGRFGLLGIFSFNGNKTITCGGGGMIITDNEKLGALAKHLTTQAKIPHQWNFEHDQIGYNYRLPNINAALACAQIEQLDNFIENKRELAQIYKKFFDKIGIPFFNEPKHSFSNYWLNSIFFENKTERDLFLEFSNNNGVITRPAWTLMTKLPMFLNCYKGNIENAEWVVDRLVNIPSSVRL